MAAVALFPRITVIRAVLWLPYRRNSAIELKTYERRDTVSHNSRRQNMSGYNE